MRSDSDDPIDHFSWEHIYFPVYYVPKADMKEKTLQNGTPSAKHKGQTDYDLVVGGKTAAAAVTVFTTGDLAGYARIEFDKVDAWFEEDERIYAHPRDPYKVGRMPPGLSSSPVRTC
jgi:hypothetical protein